MTPPTTGFTEGGAYPIRPLTIVQSPLVDVMDVNRREVSPREVVIQELESYQPVNVLGDSPTVKVQLDLTIPVESTS